MTAPDAAALHVPDEAFESLRLALEYAFETDEQCIERIAIPVMAPYLSDLAARVRTMAVAAPDDSAAKAYREAARHIAECAERLEGALTAANY